MTTIDITTRLIDDSRKLLQRIRRKERRVLVRTGSFGRTVMRRLFKRRKKSSKPGSPPNIHSPGSTGLKMVRWAVQPDNSVVIGPLRFSTPRGGRTEVFTRQPVPDLLNRGGRAKIATQTLTSRTTKTARFRPRPFRDRAYPPTRQFLLERLRQERL